MIPSAARNPKSLNASPDSHNYHFAPLRVLRGQPISTNQFILNIPHIPKILLLTLDTRSNVHYPIMKQLSTTHYPPSTNHYPLPNPMTTTTQQTPAQRLAHKIRVRSNDTRDLLDLLHDIAQGDYDATTNDRISASRILLDRGYGKCARQPLDADPDQTSSGQSSHPVNPDSDNPRPVTQIKDALNDTLGPAPTNHSPQSTNHSPQSPIQSIVQEHVIAITNDADTLIDVLEEIAYADADDPTETRPRVTAYHRRQAAQILIDRGAGTTAALDAAPSQPTPEQRAADYWSRRSKRRVDPDDLAKARAEVQRMKDEGILTPDYDNPGPPITVPEIPKWFDPTPYLEEASEKFWAGIELTLERQKAWPAIEERRRKKLARMYPSHSEDEADHSDLPDP